MTARFHIVSILCSILLVIFLSVYLCEAAEKKIVASIQVKDALTVPGQPATVEAKLEAKGVLADVALGGEPLELIVDGKAVATAMTGGDGRAFLTYTTKTQGVIPIQVRVGGCASLAGGGAGESPGMGAAQSDLGHRHGIVDG